MAPSSSSDKLRANLHAVNTQLATMKQRWESEKHKLLGENATLKDATKRLNAEVRQAKDDMKRYSETERGKASMQAVSLAIHRIVDPENLTEPELDRSWTRRSVWSQSSKVN